jgi:hypothetical protein
MFQVVIEVDVGIWSSFESHLGNQQRLVDAGCTDV